MDVERSQVEPWSLSRLPHYDEAMSLDEIPAGDITEDVFRRDYVEKNKPCLLVGAAKHWPAYRNWTSAKYLKQKTTRFATIGVSRQPSDDHSGTDRAVLRKRFVRFHDFLDKAASTGDYVKGTANLAANEAGGLGALLADVGTYPFLSEISGSTIPGTEIDATYRLMFFRRSYTDWHYHVGEEALMTQVVGTKEIVLVPPTEESWNILKPIEETKGYLFDVDVKRFPRYADLRPYRVISRPGDALYIPVYWWHAVEACGNEFGVTFIATFETPPRVRDDLSYPAAQERSLSIEELLARRERRARVLESEGFAG